MTSRPPLESTTRPLDELPPDPRDASISQLLHRAAERDWAAWDVLVNRFDRLVVSAGRRIGLNHADAADVAQLTWLRLFEHAHQIREPERLPAWLTATARREALRVAMDSKRFVLRADPTMENGVDRHGAVDDVYPVDGHYSAEAEEALRRLPGGYQRLLRLLMSDECPSYTEVAAQLGIPIGSIGPMRMRALEMLRRTPEFAAAVGARRAAVERHAA